MSKKVIILGILLLSWMALIYYMSSDNGDTSGQKSSDVVMFIIDKYDKITGASKERILYHQSTEFMDQANYLFRKICHFTEYLVLIILSFSFLLAIDKWSILKCSVYSCVFSIIYAILDEYHQTFVNGRSGQVSDVLIDIFGVVIGFLFIFGLKKNKLIQK